MFRVDYYSETLKVWQSGRYSMPFATCIEAIRHARRSPARCRIVHVHSTGETQIIEYSPHVGTRRNALAEISI